MDDNVFARVKSTIDDGFVWDSLNVSQNKEIFKNEFELVTLKVM